MAYFIPIFLFALLFTANGGAQMLAPAWPRCEVRTADAGGPAILVDDAVHAPIMFSGNNQFGRDEVLLETLELAAEADIPFFTFNLGLPWNQSDEEALATIGKFRAAHPEGYFLVRMWMGPSAAWLKEHPGHVMTTASGETHPFATPASEPWILEATAQLRDRLRLIVESPHAERFVGVGLHYLETAEWFYPRANEFWDYSEANQRAFRQWLENEYRNGKRLRQAWGDEEVTLDEAELPRPEAREAAAWGPFRDPEAHRPAIDMQRFQCDAIVSAIAQLARTAKEATSGRSLVGTFYGYLFELNHNGPRALAQSGHLAFRKILDNPDIDMIFAPYAYFERGLGEPGHFHLPVDSAALAGKLAIMEEDSYTHLAQPPKKGQPAPGWFTRTESLEETFDLTRRNHSRFLAHRCGFWIFDLLSDGRWNSRAFWRGAALTRRMAAELRSHGPFQPQVAFAASEQTVHALRANTHPELLQSLAGWRAEMDRMGCPVGYYLLSDMKRLPLSVRMLVLPNAYDPAQVDQRVIRGILERGGVVVYTYAAGALGKHGPSVEGIRALTGFHVEALLDGIVPSIEEVGTAKQYPVSAEPWALRFVIEPGEGMEMLAHYADGAGVSAAAREPEDGGTVVYTAMPKLSAEMLRALAQRAGVHLYRDTPGIAAAAGQYLMVHTADGDEDMQEHYFTWHEPASRVLRIVPPTAEARIETDTPRVRDELPPRTTAIYKFE